MSGIDQDIRHFDIKIDTYMNRIKWLRKQISRYRNKILEYNKLRNEFVREHLPH